MLTEHPQALQSVFRPALQQLQSGIAITGSLQRFVDLLITVDLIKRITELLCCKLFLEHVGIDSQVGQPLVSKLVFTIAHVDDRRSISARRISPLEQAPTCPLGARSWRSPPQAPRQTSARSERGAGSSGKTARLQIFHPILEPAHAVSGSTCAEPEAIAAQQGQPTHHHQCQC